MEEVKKYINFSVFCNISAASLGVLGAQQIVNNKNQRGLKGKMKAFLITLGGVTTGVVAHNLITSYIYTHCHEKSSSTKAGVEKVLDISGL